MYQKTVIEIKNVGKKFYLHQDKPTLLETALFRKWKEFWALKNINLRVRKGERLGIIGPNGAGKSTLLRLISGITTPTVGTIETEGRVASLIDLRAGFDSDLSGRENLFINGLLLGMTKEELKEKFNKILRFSGLRQFIDAPLHAYSSGMILRLGFSIAAHYNPDILLVDESFEVGDEKFRTKCRTKLKELYSQEKTIVLVSHNLPMIKLLCPRTIWLDKGKLKMQGESKEVVKKYLAQW